MEWSEKVPAPSVQDLQDMSDAELAFLSSHLDHCVLLLNAGLEQATRMAWKLRPSHQAGN